MIVERQKNMKIYYRNLTGEMEEVYNNYLSIKQPIVTFINNTNNSWNKNGMNFKNLRSTSINMPSNAIHKVNYNIPNNYNNVNRMRHLQIKTCFFCDKPGHLTKDCADLARIK